MMRSIGGSVAYGVLSVGGVRRSACVVPSGDDEMRLVALRHSLGSGAISCSTYELDESTITSAIETVGFADGFDSLALDDELQQLVHGRDGSVHLVPEELDDYVIQGWYHDTDSGFAPVSWEQWEEVCPRRQRGDRTARSTISTGGSTAPSDATGIRARDCELCRGLRAPHR